MTERRQCRQDRQAGLSLMELLLALALMALIATAIGSSLGLGLGLYKRSEAIGRDGEPIAHRVQLRRWIERTAPEGLLAPFATAFETSPNGFTFVTLAETPFAPASAALRIAVTLDDRTLKYTATELDDDGASQVSYIGILARDSQSVRFSYFDKRAISPGWRDDWPLPDRPPSAIRITIAPGSHPAWPDFIVRLRLGNP